MKKTLKFLLTGLCIFSICACSSNSTITSTKDSISMSNTENNNTLVSPIQSENAQKVYHIGEKLIINNDGEEYSITFTGIRETDERNQFSDKQADRVVIISYDYENISKPSDLHISDINFKLYDKNSLALETYPSSVKYSQAVGIGRKSSGESAFALNSTDNYIELEYYDNMFNSKPDCMVVFEW